MSKKVSRITAAVMLIAAVGFTAYALNHPEASFPWRNEITVGLIIVYLAAMLFLFAAPFKK